VRVAFVVSKKVGKAVVRNRVRRRLREGLRVTLQAGLPAAWPAAFDLLVMVRPEAADADSATLRDALIRAVDRAVAA
jgi:ribonuclease P protein component